MVVHGAARPLAQGVLRTMYQFSRSIFRELAPGVVSARGEDLVTTAARQLGVTTPFRELIAARMGAAGANAAPGGGP